MPTVKLMIAWHIEYRAGKGLLGPCHAACFDINVTRQDDYVGIHHFWHKRAELMVQI
ncbi:hypothetical protein D3C84_1223500 [compost metagenome]